MTRWRWLGLALCAISAGFVVATVGWTIDPSHPWLHYAIAVPIAVVALAVIGVLVGLATVARWW